MKDNLLELLMNLFEKTLTQLKEQHVTLCQSDTEASSDFADSDDPAAAKHVLIAPATSKALRVFTEEERQKLTKTSYQFLMRMMTMGILAEDALEKVLHRLFFSDSRFVSLQETKWIIRNVLEDTLNIKQLAFLDLVLYHNEDKMALH